MAAVSTDGLPVPFHHLAVVVDQQHVVRRHLLVDHAGGRDQVVAVRHAHGDVAAG